MTDTILPPSIAVALHAPTTAHSVSAGGANVHYRGWNADDSDKPPLLFAHGYRGHSRWWDFIAPFFTDNFRVFAMDFSGMGDSDRRETYSGQIHTHDIAAVIQSINAGAATVVGHSYGGGRVIRLCGEAPELINHAIVLDSFADVLELARPHFPPLGRPTPYADYASALARFRLVPEQPALPALLEHVARHSLREVEGGWHWKFDTRMNATGSEHINADDLSRVHTPVDYVYGANSKVILPERANRIVELLGQSGRAITLPESGHHMMMDQPLATISVLRALLA